MLNIHDEETKQRSRIQKYIQRCILEGIIEEEKDGKLCVCERYGSTWSKVKKLVVSLGDQIFYGDNTNNNNNNPFVIEKKTSIGKYSNRL